MGLGCGFGLWFRVWTLRAIGRGLSLSCIRIRGALNRWMMEVDGWWRIIPYCLSRELLVDDGNRWMMDDPPLSTGL